MAIKDVMVEFVHPLEHFGLEVGLATLATCPRRDIADN
jgi:hypothetical protein